MPSAQKIHTILLLTLVLLLAAGCNSTVGFSDAPNESASSSQPQGSDEPGPTGVTPPTTKTQTDTFIIRGETSAPLDIVWIIDNSLSMSEEVRNVQNNLRRFIEQVKSKTDLRMAVISAQSGTEAMRVPTVAGISIRVVDRQVESADALTILALSFCRDNEVARGTSAFATPPLYLRVESFNYAQFCALSKLQTQVYPEFNNSVVHLALGDNRFYRAEAAKAFIIVTDDDSNPDAWNYVRGYNSSWPDVAWDVWTNGLSAQRFHEHVKTRFPGQRVKTFSFIDPVGQENRPSINCGFNKGHEYLKLATLTSGATFDICQTDWSTHFDSLVRSVVTHAQKQFPLSKNASNLKISSVLIDGRPVAKNLYSLENGHLVVDTSLIELSIGKILHVTYEGSW